MNLDRFIKMKMIKLSTKYDISLVEISKIKNGKLKKVLNFNYRLLEEQKKNNISKKFYNKRELVSWLACLN